MINIKVFVKTIKNWIFSFGQGVADAEDRFVKSMFEEDIDKEKD
jgi:hypothetical protein